MNPFFKETREGIRLRIRVQPRATQNQVIGVHGDALKVRITSPPVDGAANKQCVQFIAKYMGLSRSAVELVSGASSRNKTIHLRVPEKNIRKELLIKLQALMP